MTSIIGNKILKLDKIDSTNKYCKEYLINSPENNGFIVITYNQERGIGQGNNSWESKKNKNLTFSFIIFHNETIIAEKQFIISIFISVSIVQFLNNFSDEKFEIKWPNDIYYKNKKIAGILIENFIQGRFITKTICGIGINVNQKKFVSDAPNPISLLNIEKKEFCLKQLLISLINILNFNYSYILKKNFNELYETYTSILFRKNIFSKFIIDDKVIIGTIKGINEYGQLQILNKKNEILTFSMHKVKYVI